MLSAKNQILKALQNSFIIKCYSKKELTSAYDCSAHILKKWCCHVYGIIPIEEYRKITMFTPAQVTKIVEILGLPASMIREEDLMASNQLKNSKRT